MNDWIRRIRGRGNLGFSQRGQGWILASFSVIGIQERNACWGTLTEFYSMLVAFEMLIGYLFVPLLIPGVITLC